MNGIWRRVDYVHAFWKESWRPKISSWDLRQGQEGSLGTLGSIRSVWFVSLFLFFSQLQQSIFFYIIALMEYCCSDDKPVASRIFEKRLYYFGDEIDYVLRYLSFLISFNDENSKHFAISRLLYSNFQYWRICPLFFSDARALFERVIPNFSPNHARPLWERWARYSSPWW